MKSIGDRPRHGVIVVLGKKQLSILLHAWQNIEKIQLPRFKKIPKDAKLTELWYEPQHHAMCLLFEHESLPPFHINERPLEIMSQIELVEIT